MLALFLYIIYRNKADKKIALSSFLIMAKKTQKTIQMLH